MPTENYYRHIKHNSNRLREFINHHLDRKTRHISRYEAKMLEDIADELERIERE